MIPLLYARKIGDPNRPALVCLHGFMGAAADFDFLVQGLCDHFYLILPDLPGHGQSGYFRSDEVWDIPFCARAVADIVRPHAPAHLLGYSLGGRVALTLAVNEPDLVRSLILESAMPGIEDEQARRERVEHDDCLAGRLRREALDGFMREWYRQPLFTGIRKQVGFDAMFKQRLTNNPGLLARALSQMSSGRMPGLWAKTPDIRCPALLINGSLDTKYARINARMQDINPSFIRHEASNIGHNVHFSCPEWYQKIISDFLGTTP